MEKIEMVPPFSKRLRVDCVYGEGYHYYLRSYRRDRSYL